MGPPTQGVRITAAAGTAPCGRPCGLKPAPLLAGVDPRATHLGAIVVAAAGRVAPRLVARRRVVRGAGAGAGAGRGLLLSARAHAPGS
jgi:hypothetical protein